MGVVVLGVDPSLSNTGMCYGTGPDTYETRCITYKPAKGECADVVGRIGRLNALIYEVEHVLEAYITPDVVMIEGYAYGKTTGGEMLAEFGGMLRCRLFDHTPDIKEVTPGQLKKFALGKGVGKKEQILLQVFKRWGVECANADEADAYVLYRIGLCYAGVCEPENKVQAGVIDDLRGGVL